MTEIWRDIAGYEGLYQVSNIGRVRSSYKGGRVLKLQPNHNGYLTVRLCRNNKGKTHRVHRLVAEAFIDNPDDKPEVNHVDGIKTDNRVENLEWCTSFENMRHAYATGLQSAPQGKDSPVAKLIDEQVRYIRENPDGLTQRELAGKFGVNQVTISRVQLGKAYRNAGGHIRKNKLPSSLRVPDDVREQICREYIPNICGHGSYALAKKFGVSQSTILSIIHEGRPDCEITPQRVPDEVRAEIRRLYVYGSHEFSSYALAKKYGVDPSTILNIVHEN